MEEVVSQTAVSTERYDSIADNILRIALDIGEGLLRNGAEVHRIEYTIEKICKAYGAHHVEVFTIHSLILASVRMKDGSYSSQNRRILRAENNMLALERYNALSRKICESTPDIEIVDREIKEIKKNNKYPLALSIIGNAIAAGAFALLFCGSLRDGLAAGLVGIVIALLARVKARYLNDVTRTLLTSFIAGLLSCTLVIVGIGERMDMIIIGTIMLLIPGLSLGNAVRDLLGGDTLAGTLKVVQACISAIVIAIGYAISIAMLGGFCDTSLGAPYSDTGMLISRLISSFVGTVGFAFMFKLAPKRCLAAGIGGMLTYVVYELAIQLNAGVLLAAFLSALFMALYSETSARIFRAPSILFLFPCAIPIVPGGALYYMMYNLVYYHQESFFTYLELTGHTILGIALGLSVASIGVGALFDLSRRIQKRIKDRR